MGAVKCSQMKCGICGQLRQIPNGERVVLSEGDMLELFCRVCGKDTVHVRVLTKKEQAEIRRNELENSLKKGIVDRCSQYGFSAKFVYQSVVIQTDLSKWSFDYHDGKKTLHHESTVKINFNTGMPAKTHIQFKDKKMTNEEVIDYIYRHDVSRN